MSDNYEKFEVISRALIEKDGKILVCKIIGRDYYFLPGGHIEFGETAIDALSRELQEEANVNLHSSSFIGSCENIYMWKNTPTHEFIFVFAVSIAEEVNDAAEDHIELSWLSLEEFAEEKVYPRALTEAVLKWRVDGQNFFVSHRE